MASSPSKSERISEPEIDLDAQFVGQLDLLKEWFGAALGKLQAENLELKRRLAARFEPDCETALAEVHSAVGVVSVDQGAAAADRNGKRSGRKRTSASIAGGAEAQAEDAASVAVEVAELGAVPDDPMIRRVSSALQANSQNLPSLRKRWTEGSEVPSGAQHLNKECSASTLLRNKQADSFVPKLNFTLPMHPHSTLRVSWDCFAAVALLFDAIMIPLSVFSVQSLFITAGSYVVLSYWTLDMLMQCVTAYHTRKGGLVTSLPEIAKRYALTWFLPDVVIVGSEWAMVVLARSKTGISGYRAVAKGMRALRVVRVLRVLRLVKLRELIMRVEEFIHSEYISIVWGVVCNLFILLMLNHVCACLWFLVGSRSQDGWVRFYELADAPFASQYIVSLHWSLTQFTPASMMVQPQTTAERVVAVGVVLMAMVTFSQFVSSVTAGMTRLRTIQAEQVTDTFRLRKFLKVYQVSHNLSARIMRYIDIAVATRRKILPRSSVKLLEYLSGPLNIELAMEMYWPHLEDHPYFCRDLPTSMIGHLCYIAMENVMVSQHDTIFHRFRKATHFYLLQSGTTTYKVREKGLTKRMVRVPQGSWFSEQALWVHWYYQGTMQALTECFLLAMDVDKFGEVVKSHITGITESRIYAAEFLEQLYESIEIYGRAWDVKDSLMHTSHGNSLSSDTQMKLKSDPHMTNRLLEITKAENLEVQLMLDRDE